MSLYVVTGTDTGVGKTFVTTRLIEKLRADGVDAIGLKPIETGWIEPSSDAAELAMASGRSIEQTLWRHYALAAAPAVAAAAEDEHVDHRDMLAWIHRQAADHHVCLVEGAGGWMVPFAEDLLFCDMVRSLDPVGVLVVGASKLGTINHSLLTAEAVTRDARLLAIALSVRPEDSAAASNREQIAARSTVPVFLVPQDLAALAAMFHVEHRTQGR